MGLKIKHSSFLEKRYLEVTPAGVTYYQAAAFGHKRRFLFSQIDAILLTRDGVLSFQVGREVFSLQTKLAKAKHKQVIEAFVGGVRQAAGAA